MPRKIKVALLFGGRSAEHDVSCLSAAAVFRNLDPRVYDTVSVYITRSGLWRTVPAPDPSGRPPRGGRSLPFLPWAVVNVAPALRADIYFPVLHGPYGEDGTIQGLLEMADAPYVGSGVLGSALGMDKAVSKALFRAAGLPVAPFRAIAEAEWRNGAAAILAALGREFAPPLFVKPANMGSSVGITKIKDPAGLRPAIETAFRYDGKALVEKGIDGLEIECSVLGNDAPESSPPGQVIPFREFYDYEDKYLEGKTKFVVPADLPHRVADRVRRLAAAAFRAIDAAGLARVDFFYDPSARHLYVNEINTMPGFTEISMYPKLWEAAGLPFPRLVDRLIALGFERHRARKRCVERMAGR